VQSFPNTGTSNDSFEKHTQVLDDSDISGLRASRRSGIENRHVQITRPRDCILDLFCLVMPDLVIVMLKAGRHSRLNGASNESQEERKSVASRVHTGYARACHWKCVDLWALTMGMDDGFIREDQAHHRHILTAREG
jgi:hypothetical protein